MQKLKVIGNFFVAVMLLIATTGMTMHKHYCLGQLKSIEINHKTKSCCADLFGAEDDADPCCNEVEQDLKVNELNQSLFSFEAQTSFFVVSWFALPDYSSDLFSAESAYAYLDASPPLLNKDIPVLIQSFLI